MTERSTPEPKQRLRITYSQTDPLRYVGHLDVVRTWERALRRADVPLAYSRGYNPQPKLQFASALPLGASGRHELADVILNEPLQPEAFLGRVQRQLPPGLTVIHVEEVPLRTRALQALLRACEWQVDVEAELSSLQLEHRLQALLATSQIPSTRLRKGRPVEYDLRPLLLDLHYSGLTDSGWHRLLLTLRSEPGATGRPDAVIDALGLNDPATRIERLRCIFADPEPSPFDR